MAQPGKPSLKARIGRIPILDVRPAAPDPRYAAKAFDGEVVPFSATVFREGHDSVGALLELQSPSGTTRSLRMRELSPGSDRFARSVRIDATGDWRFRVRGFSDDWGTWLSVAQVKLPAGLDPEVTRELGAQLASRAAAQGGKAARPAAIKKELLALAALLRDPAASVSALLSAIDTASLSEEFSLRPLASLDTVSAWHSLHVERSRAGVGSWYEFFPRSEGAKKNRDGSWTSGTFATASKRLDAVAEMGFDVVYLPPIHPIGTSFRKGPNNTLNAGPNDPGSPWAVGGAAGGHDAIHPDLGTVADFEAFVSHAAELGIEIALDLALQASPDHPWVREHPEWFTTLPDGTIAYAENPPKKYQDIYPLNFDNDPAGLYAEVLRVVRYWIARGVQIFRVDNPHTKPVEFWEWLIATVNAEHPGVVFLAEAFTRPPMMQTLAMIGFQQSYSYFTWRNTKAELEAFLSSIAHETADVYRPNLFVNTPDILSEYLQYGGRAAFTVRATIAATAAPLWGVYSGFELFESVARPGAEEAIDNEKYEFKPRDFAGAEKAGASLALYLGMLNQIRREHPALGQLRNLRLQHTEDEAVLAYSKYLPAEFTHNGTPDRVLVVVNVDPHSVRETRVHLDFASLDIPADSTVRARDLVTGEEWAFGQSNYVRLDAFERPAHILQLDVVAE